MLRLQAGEFSALVSRLGATLVSFFVPDGHGRVVDLLLGPDSEPDRAPDPFYFGCIIGRVAGRISGSRFTLNDKTYRLDSNEGVNHLHGGVKGFNKCYWDSKLDSSSEESKLRLSLISPDGDQGYPSRLDVTVTYLLSAQGRLEIRYEARSDGDTVINLTNHAYFNLGGDACENILDHRLSLRCSRYIATRPDLIPTGEIATVESSPLDFRSGKRLGNGLTELPPVPGGPGYDHCLLLDRSGPGLFSFAELVEPISGRSLSVSTTFPAVQVYSGNFLDGVRGKGGKEYRKYAGLCLETQGYPDAVNNPSFPSMLLRKDEDWIHRTVFEFRH